MKIEPVKRTDTYKDLTSLQNTTRILAIIVAFIGTFVWFFKIVFF